MNTNGMTDREVELREHIRDELSAWIFDNGYSQHNAAVAIGVSDASINDWVRGKAAPSPRMMPKYLKACPHMADALNECWKLAQKVRANARKGRHGMSFDEYMRKRDWSMAEILAANKPLMFPVPS